MPEAAKLAKKTPLKVVKDPPPAPPSNAPDRETFHYFVGLIDIEDGKVAAARKARKDVRRRASDAGLSLEIVDLLRRKRDKEAETAGSWIQSLMEGFKWMGLKAAVQLSLFPEEHEKQSVTDRAEMEGYVDGLEGKSAVGDRYEATNELSQARLKGWHRGQAVIQKRFIDKQAEPA